MPITGGVSAIDPYVLPELTTTTSRGNQNYGGRTAVSPYLTSGESTCVLPIFGDSTSTNTVNSIYTATQNKNHNFNVYNGGCYSSVEPLLGCQINGAQYLSGCWATRLADSLITAGTYTRVILVPFGVGGTVAADYAAGGLVNGRIGAVKRRLDAYGLTPTFILLQIGANDKNGGTSQASMTASLQSIIDTWRNLGATAKILVAKHSMFAGATSSAIQAAEAAVLNGTDVKAGADADSLDTSNRWDSTHFNATGSAALATLWKNAMAVA